MVDTDTVWQAPRPSARLAQSPRLLRLTAVGGATTPGATATTHTRPRTIQTMGNLLPAQGVLRRQPLLRLCRMGGLFEAQRHCMCSRYSNQTRRWSELYLSVVATCTTREGRPFGRLIRLLARVREPRVDN